MDMIRPASGNRLPEAALTPAASKSKPQAEVFRDSVSISGIQARDLLKELESLAVGLEKPEAARGPQLVYADCVGQITHLGLQVDGEVTSDSYMGRQVFSTIRTLFKEMEDDTKFTIVCDKSSDVSKIKRIMEEINMPDRERVNLLKAPYNITSWMRDNMVMASIPGDPAHARMIDKIPFQSHDNPRLPRYIADQTPEVIYMKDNYLRTDGGDVVADARKAYVGYDSIYLTAVNLFRKTSMGKESFNSVLLANTPPILESPYFTKRVVFHEMPQHSHEPRFHLEDNPGYTVMRGVNVEKASLSQAEKYFEGVYGKDVVTVGADDPSTKAKEKPATFHIDMGVTPVNNSTVLLGSPKMAMDIINSWSQSQYDAANSSLGRESGLSGDILDYLVKHNSKPDAYDSSVQKVQNNFDAQEKELRKQGKHIIKIPYLEGKSPAPYITYGNCIMQDFTARDGRKVKNVFLPIYGIPMDNVAKEVYMKQGFKVIPLPLAAFTRLAGAIRCMSNYLGRSPAA